MKQFKLLFMLIALMLAGTCLAQELPRHVFAAGGGNFESSAMHASWTIGQSSPVASSVQTGIILCPGFQQFDDQLVSVEEITQEGKFLVYPNPCGDFVQLDIQLEQASDLQYKLYDFSGKTLMSKEIPSRATNYQEVIDLSHLAPGMYHLMMITTSGNTASNKSITIIRH